LPELVKTLRSIVIKPSPQCPHPLDRNYRILSCLYRFGVGSRDQLQLRCAVSVGKQTAVTVSRSCVRCGLGMHLQDWVSKLISSWIKKDREAAMPVTSDEARWWQPKGYSSTSQASSWQRAVREESLIVSRELSHVHPVHCNAEC
jgi:hypothetical protein